MTTLGQRKVSCSQCAKETDQSGIKSTSAFGSPDLDTRPSEMVRSAIHVWVQRCPSCGYCASDLSKGEPRFLEILQTPGYVAQLNHKDFPNLANSFLCKSMIDEVTGDWATATWALIHAAWACDDAERVAQAIICRKDAALMLRKAEAHSQRIAHEPGVSKAILIDLLRRAGRFEEAQEVIQGYREVTAEGDIRRIIDYEMELIQTGDLACHTVTEALEEKTPSPRDHRSHYDKLIQKMARLATKRWWPF